jgi:cytochrome b subunit of formate dehydrogenase
MIRAFGAKNKLKFVDGSMDVPDEDDLNRSAWERCNHLVQSWIINSVSGLVMVHKDFPYAGCIRIANVAH